MRPSGDAAQYAWINIDFATPRTPSIVLMPFVTGTPEMVAQAEKDIHWAAIDAMTDADIARIHIPVSTL